MFGIMQDLRLALRQLRRSGAFTITVIVTLALGIGLNAAIFTMVDSILLRPLGYHDADRIYGLNTRFLAEGRSIPRLGGGDYLDLAGKTTSLEYAAYYSEYEDNLQTGNRTSFIDIGHVSPSFGKVMGVEPLAGRVFLPDSDPSGRSQVKDPQEALVSSAFARENFGSAANALGKILTYDAKPRVVVGVMPEGFSFPGKTKVWIESASAPDVLNRTAYNQSAIGKVKAGITVGKLNAELATLSKQLGASYPEDKLKALEAISLQDQIVGKIRPTLRLLMGSVIVVLLIVCANITHLQLVRATKLRREITIRTALGATRSALARRAGLEVLLLAIAGCIVGVLIALPALKLLVQLAPQEIPRLADLHLNLDVVAFSFMVSLLTMVLTSLLPLWRSWQIDPALAMKQDAARGLESRGSGRLRQALIVGEVALTLTLSVAALLLVRQLIAESRQDLGFSSESLIMLDMHKTRAAAKLTAAQELDPTFEQASGRADLNALNSLVSSVRAVPGVASVAAIYGAPMSAGGSNVGYAVHGVSEFKAPFTGLPNANFSVLTPGYFETMGIPILRGRAFTDADRAGASPVMMISESAAKQSFAGVDPIGKEIETGFDDVGGWSRIIGVVGDVRQDSPASVPYPTLYVPVAQHVHSANDMQVMVRTRVNADALTLTLAKVMKDQFPQVAVQITTMREDVGESERAQHFRTLLFGSFAGVSILLAMTGMYGVTAYTVAQKRFEFALRFALGAQRAQVLSGVLGSAMTAATIGIAGGIGLSLTLMRIVSNLLGQMPAFDAASYAIAALGVLAIALSATLVPAYRAAMVEPMQVLRNE